MSDFIAPLPKLRFVDNNGNALSGGQLFTYAAGTTNKATTYTDSTGVTPNTNPIILDTRGECTCWLPTNTGFKFTLSPSTDTDPPTNSFWTVDNIIGVNGIPTPTVSEWVTWAGGQTFISATSFSVPGDQRATFQVGRRLQTTNTSGTIYSTIVSSVFSSLTTITVINDSGVLDSGLNAVNYALLSSVNDSVPRGISRGPEISIPSATSTPIGGAGSSNVLVTGTTTITSFDTVIAGIIRYVRFNGVLTLTNGAALLLPGAQNILTASGDIGIFRSAGAGNWVCIDYQAIAAGALGTTQTLVHKGLVDISATGAGQIAFPASQNASAGANTLDDYREGTFTATYTGFSTTITGTAKYTKVGSLVGIIWPNQETGTSNATTKTITGLVSALQPTITVNIPTYAGDAGGNPTATLAIISAGTTIVTVTKDFAGNPFTASGTCSIGLESTIYTVN